MGAGVYSTWSYFHGALDDLRIYDRALGDGEITELANLIDLDEGLIAYYPFDNGANDASGNGHHGSLVSGAVITSGKSGDALSFRGDEDHMLVPYDPVFDADGDFSISLWLNLDSWTVDGGGRVINKHLAFDNDDGWEIVVYDNNVVFGFAQIGGVTASLTNPEGWIHVSAIKSGSDVSLYINGELSSTNTLTGPVGTDIHPIWVGAHYGLSNFEVDGMLDELRFYNRALNQNEITQLSAEPVVTFSEWVLTVALPANQQGIMDRNGPMRLPNIIAYSMDLDPMRISSADMPAFAVNEDAPSEYYFEFRRRKSSNNVTITVEASDDLIDWSEVTAVKETVIEDYGNSERVCIEFSYENTTICFARMRVISD